MKITLKMLLLVIAEAVVYAMYTYSRPTVWIWRWMKRRLGTRLGLHVHRWEVWTLCSETDWGFCMNIRECKTCGAIDRGWSMEEGP